MPEEERFYDPELQDLDEKNSHAAFVVLAYADTLDEENYEHNTATHTD